VNEASRSGESCIALAGQLHWRTRGVPLFKRKVLAFGHALASSTASEETNVDSPTIEHRVQAAAHLQILAIRVSATRSPFAPRLHVALHVGNTIASFHL
jgi:hypothetical protein